VSTPGPSRVIDGVQYRLGDIPLVASMPGAKAKKAAKPAYEIGLAVLSVSPCRLALKSVPVGVVVVEQADGEGEAAGHDETERRHRAKGSLTPLKVCV
jgi:hypothetical protein